MVSIMSGGDVVVELTEKPRLEGDDLSYDIGNLQGEAPATADPSSLFIDTIGRPSTRMS